MRIDRDQKITVALLAGMVVLYVGAVWLPLRMKQDVLDSRLQSARAATNPVNADADDLKTLTSTVDQLRRAAGADRRVVPAAPELAELLKELGAALEALSVAEQEIQTQPVTVGATYGTIPVTLRFNADFPAVCKFLARVESMGRVVRVTRVGVEAERSTAKGPQPPQVQTELVAFFAPKEGRKS